MVWRFPTVCTLIAAQMPGQHLQMSEVVHLEAMNFSGPNILALLRPLWPYVAYPYITTVLDILYLLLLYSTVLYSCGLRSAPAWHSLKADPVQMSQPTRAMGLRPGKILSLDSLGLDDPRVIDSGAHPRDLALLKSWETKSGLMRRSVTDSLLAYH